MRNSALFLLLALALPATAAEEKYDCPAKSTPLSCYLNNAAFALMLCDATGSLNRAKLRSGSVQSLEEVSACVRDAQTAVKSRLQRALKAKPSAQKLLKDHYAAWDAHIQRFISVDEPPGLAESASRVREKASRLELE